MEKQLVVQVMKQKLGWGVFAGGGRDLGYCSRCKRTSEADPCPFGPYQAIVLNSVLLRTLVLMKMVKPSVRGSTRRKERSF